MADAERTFAADHPAALGHFPGNPVIPGALLLAEALQAVEAGLGASLSGCRIRSAKFLSPVRPGDRVRIACSRAGGDAVRFDCAVDGRAVLRGEVTCGAMPARA